MSLPSLEMGQYPGSRVVEGVVFRVDSPERRCLRFSEPSFRVGNVQRFSSNEDVGNRHPESSSYDEVFWGVFF